MKNRMNCSRKRTTRTINISRLLTQQIFLSWCSSHADSHIYHFMTNRFQYWPLPVFEKLNAMLETHEKKWIEASVSLAFHNSSIDK